MSGDMRFAMSPATPLSLTLLHLIACSEAGWAKPYTRTPSALLRCDYVLQSESIGCLLHSLPISWVPPAYAGPFSSCRSQGQTNALAAPDNPRL